MAQDGPQDSAGPSSPPPELPDGWLAQWEGVSRKWYFVQRATGKSQWEIPTEPVILTPSTTPGSIGAGPTQAPRVASPAVSPMEGMNYSANRGIFTHSTERAGLSGLLGSQGGGSGLTQLADRMLNKISKEFMPGKTGGANAYQQFPPGHPNHPASQNPYGQPGRPPQYQSAANPYGYASIGQTAGSYTGDVPQYHPQGQAMSPGGFHQSPGIHPAYSHHQYPNQPAMTPQFSPVSPVSQHSWQGHQQPLPGYPPAYPASEMQGSIDSSHAPVPPVAQPQWQLGPQPTIPHATKPTVTHLQQDPNNPASQPQFHNPTVSHQQPPQQPTQFAGNPYQQGHPIYEAPGDIQMARPQSQNHPDPSQQQQMTSMYHQHPQHGSQHSTPFTPGSGAVPASPAVASNYANNSSMTSLPGSNVNPQQGNLSHHPSLTSLSSSHTPTNRPANSFIAELPDNQVGISQTPNHPASQPSNPQHMNQPPPNGMIAEMPGSEPPIRHTPADPQFVSGPWTLPPPPPPQNRYNNSGGFSQ
ncbi:hypothetical protein PISL3812_06814 [Talaromyces islandicus]|uniref:WW domain-containing protein n=1 Tax=Talaromyces islandicus TaxID=28573 RepID=A0A0U1M2G8_TALIS|nr:hypothetical protein PISL3812_06814 [Talaromyces islandicus]